MTVVKLQNLTKQYGSHVVLQSLSMSFCEGEIIGFVGRNGSGKSVLLRCIVGLTPATSGSIEVFGKRIGIDVDFAPNTGISIEQPGLLPRKNARENMHILAAHTQRPDRNEIDRLIRLVGLDPCEKKAVGKYSMGMKQRLSIAMALLGNPKLLLLDEPMSNLDSDTAGMMRNIFQTLAHDGCTIIIATHFKEDIHNLCNTVCEFQEGSVFTHKNVMG